MRRQAPRVEVVRSHRRDIDALREAAAVLPSEFRAPLLNLVTQRSRRIVGDKRIAPYLDEVLKDDYGGAIPGGVLRQMQPKNPDPRGHFPHRRVHLDRTGLARASSSRKTMQTFTHLLAGLASH
jgi:hypothetical protein